MQHKERPSENMKTLQEEGQVNIYGSVIISKRVRREK